MSKIKLTGESSGYVEISAGNAAGNNTLEAPTSGTRLVAHEGSQDVTLNGNLTVNGVVSYEDVTSVDSVGLSTFQNGIHVTGGSVGIGSDNPTDVVDVLTGGSDEVTSLKVKTQGRVELSRNHASAPYIKTLMNSGNPNIILGDSGGDKVLINGDGSSYFNGGNIGIGTDNPDATLKVNVASGNNGVVVQNTSTANIALLGARNGDATLQVGQFGSTASGSTFGLSNADLAFIYTTTYNTTHPSALALGTVANKPIVFATNNTERLRITSAGGVGIGTDTPYVNSSFTSLSIGGSGKYGLIELNKSDGVAGSWIDVYGTNGNGDLRITTAGTSGAITFWTGGSFTEKLRITSAGRMGVGTNDPAALLEVRDSENATQGNAQIRISKGVGGGAAPTSVSRANSYLHIGGSEYNTSFGRYNIAFGYTNDEVGSGIPAYIGFVETSLSGYTQGDLVFGTRENTNATGNPAERLRITSAGNVGINESNPEVLLHLTETNADPYNTVITHLKLNNGGGNGGSGSRIELKTGAARCWIQSFIDGANSNSGGALVFATPSSGTLGTERLRITSGGQVNIGGNYTQTTYQLQVDGSIKGDYFTGESLSNRTGYKWGASGMYTLTLGGGRSGNGSSFTMFEIHGFNNSKFFEIMLNFGHAGGGIHGSYRRYAGFSNGYTSIQTLEDSGNVNYGGGGGFSITKPDVNTIRVVWNGASSYADAYTLGCEFKTTNAGAYFKNVDSAFA